MQFRAAPRRGAARRQWRLGPVVVVVLQVAAPVWPARTGAATCRSRPQRKRAPGCYRRTGYVRRLALLPGAEGESYRPGRSGLVLRAGEVTVEHAAD